MNKVAIIGLVVLLSALAFAAGFFVHHHLHDKVEQKGDNKEVATLKSALQAAQTEAADFAAERRPKLWVDQDAAHVIRELGYQHVWFLRWKNGILDGWLEFDEADGPKRVALDESRQSFDQLVKVGKKPVASGSQGNILITFRQIGKSDEFDCDVKVDFMVHLESGGGGGATYSKKGKVKLEKYEATPHSVTRFGSYSNPGYSQPFEISVNRYRNNKAAAWLSIKLVDLPK